MGGEKKQAKKVTENQMKKNIYIYIHVYVYKHSTSVSTVPIPLTYLLHYVN